MTTAARINDAAMDTVLPFDPLEGTLFGGGVFDVKLLVEALSGASGTASWVGATCPRSQTGALKLRERWTAPVGWAVLGSLVLGSLVLDWAVLDWVVLDWAVLVAACSLAVADCGSCPVLANGRGLGLTTVSSSSEGRGRRAAGALWF